jgi:hypothetical protein
MTIFKTGETSLITQDCRRYRWTGQAFVLTRWRPDSPTLAKTEGMLRFYLEGRRPPAQQPWPAALADQRADAAA